LAVCFGASGTGVAQAGFRIRRWRDISVSTERINLLDFSMPRMRILHLSWFAFFVTFYMWFSHGALIPFIKDELGLGEQEAKALLFLNVALTIPARTLVGSLVDRFGPRLMFSMLLAVAGVFCLFFACAQTYSQLAAARFLLGAAGAGFVIGIRLVTEWFPARQAGTAQGIYGGWGNFGASAANFALPALALWFGAQWGGWRAAVALAGVVAIAYAVVFYAFVRNTPQGATYFSPKKLGPMEVSSWSDLVLYAIMSVPMFIAMAIIAWRLSPAGVALLSQYVTNAIYAGLAIWLIWQIASIVRMNRDSLRRGVPEFDRYKFKQVAIVNLAYMVTFGSEVAVVSMLPLFFTENFSYSPLQAASLAGCFMAMNLIARPGGGYFSDRFGRKKTLLVTVMGSALGYYAMSLMTPDWSFVEIGAVVVFCSFFVQAGAGATFGVVPTIKRRLTGQIAGTTGAYGNIGSAVYLLIFTCTDGPQLFLIIAATCAVVAVLIQLLLEEPRGHIAEMLPDGSVQLIDVG
jgi:NNP family nitrate/nitrite transporter-like MFS transporter